ncbi:MAG: NADH-quinone oxidoreductase subunit M [Halobacteriales archaeon]|nr:NADH-quinone oxidoreductase subunit M [Halobacteriales archaeon]
MRWISLLVVLPLVAAFVTVVVHRLSDGGDTKYVAFLASLVPLSASFYVWQVPFERAGNALTNPEQAQLVERVPWFEIAGYEVEYLVALDGISMTLVLLTTLLTTTAIMSAWSSIGKREGAFYALVLFLESALLGVFVAFDFFVFYVFWEAVLIPMYFLIAVWGGERRRYAAMKFFVYTNIASLIMFIGVVALYLNANVADTSLMSLTAALDEGALTGAFGLSAGTLRVAAFVALFVGFAVKVPIVPFHTWLPDAHVQAPSPVSVLLAGVLLKMGTYALLRFNFTMLPDVAATFALPIAVIGVVSVIYGALLAMAQTDLKRIVAYSSISSMGYVIVGLTAYTQYAVGGATFQMLSHGLISGLMFMVVGVVYHKTGTREVGELSGMIGRTPLVAGVFVASAFAYMGLPGMSGFPAELFVFIGSMSSETLPYATLVVPVAMFGIVLVAGYLLFAMQRVLFGEFRVGKKRRATAADGGAHDVTDASLSEALPMLVLLAVIVALGLQPDIAYDMIETSTAGVVELVAGGGS